MSDYQKRIAAEMIRLGLDQRTGLTLCNVLHDVWCPMANPPHRGPCRCEPTLQFVDENGRRIEPVATH